MPTTTQLPKRTAEVLARVQQDMKPAEIAADLGVSRNAVYQHITKLKRAGIIDDGRAPRAKQSLSVDDTVKQFTATLEKQLVAIDARGSELERELESLHAERERVLNAIEKVTQAAK